MSTGRPKPALTLTEDEREQLSGLTRSRTVPNALIARAKVVLWSADGKSNTQIAERLGWTKATVGKWRAPAHLLVIGWPGFTMRFGRDDPAPLKTSK